MIKIKFKNSPKTIASKLESVFDEAQSDFKERLGNFYGDKYINNKMFSNGLVFDDKRSAYRGTGGPNKAAMEEIGQIYEKAWQEKYKELQERHKSWAEGSPTVPIDQSGDSPHIKRKRVTAGQTAPHNNRKVVVEDNPWTVWTGLFREKIGDAFTSDFSNEYVEIANLLMSGGFRMLGSGYPHMYDKFTNWFQSKGIVEQQPFEMDESTAFKQNEIYDKMAFYARQNFAEPFVEIFNNIDIKV